MAYDLFFVFDVESIGLHGDAFAAAFVVVDRSGSVLDSGLHACPRRLAWGTEEDRRWVEANVPTLDEDCTGVDELKDRFWAAWRRWRDRGAVMAADCPWPVEARFLIDCLNLSAGYADESPCPLIDVASVRLGADLDPLMAGPRLPDELPSHHPLNDARNSARLLIEALDRIEARCPAS